MDPVSSLANDLSAVNVSQRETAKTSAFQWKVDAPEFVPRYMMAGGAGSTASSSTPSGIGPVSSISYAAVASGVSATSSASAHAALTPGGGGASAEVLAATTLDYVHWLLNEIQNRPETFENMCNDLLSYIQQESSFNEEILINSVLSPILEASLSVDNFAFLCVRLIVFLHDNYQPSASPNQGISIPIRDCILTCLEKEFAERKNALKMPEQTPRLFMFVNVLCMFSTLLLTNGQALKPLITAVYDILDIIMNERIEENVRFSIQTLKTVGAHLECAEKAETGEGTPRMDALIDHLERIGTEPDSKLSDNTKFMIRNLRGVRRHWAYAAPPNPSSPQQQQLEQQSNFCQYEDQSLEQSAYLESSFNYENYGTTADLSAAALYFTPDSSSALYFTPASLTPAEAAFFERVCIEGGSGDPQNTSSEDDAIADAYEEFLKHLQPPGQQ